MTKSLRSSITISLCAFAVIATTLGCSRSISTRPSKDAANVASVPSETNKTTSAVPSTTTEISGAYTITGKNENGGGAYEGSLAVTKRDAAHQFSWTSGGKTMTGLACERTTTSRSHLRKARMGKVVGSFFIRSGRTARSTDEQVIGELIRLKARRRCV